MKNNLLLIFCALILTINVGCNHDFHKGLARWDEVYSIEEARERDVLAGTYQAEPFEYEDSVFHLKLVFSNVYAVYWNWLDEEDSTWKHTDHSYLIAEVDTSLSFGLDKLDSSKRKHWYDAKKYFTLDVSCLCIDTMNNVIDFRPNEYFSDSLIVPIKASVTYKKSTQRSEKEIITIGRILFLKKQE